MGSDTCHWEMGSVRGILAGRSLRAGGLIPALNFMGYG